MNAEHANYYHHAIIGVFFIFKLVTSKKGIKNE